MVSETRRAAIRLQYRMLRLAANKTQAQVEARARLKNGERLKAGRYWKFENGFAFPDDDERKAIAAVLRVQESDLPSEQIDRAVAS